MKVDIQRDFKLRKPYRNTWNKGWRARNNDVKKSFKYVNINIKGKPGKVK